MLDIEEKKESRRNEKIKKRCKSKEYKKELYCLYATKIENFRLFKLSLKDRVKGSRFMKDETQGAGKKCSSSAMVCFKLTFHCNIHK